jgi:hypothetical protein
MIMCFDREAAIMRSCQLRVHILEKKNAKQREKACNFQTSIVKSLATTASSPMIYILHHLLHHHSHLRPPHHHRRRRQHRDRIHARPNQHRFRQLVLGRDCQVQTLLKLLQVCGKGQKQVRKGRHRHCGVACKRNSCDIFDILNQILKLLFIFENPISTSGPGAKLNLGLHLTVLSCQATKLSSTEPL